MPENYDYYEPDFMPYEMRSRHEHILAEALTLTTPAEPSDPEIDKIGRASCRERV